MKKILTNIMAIIVHILLVPAILVLMLQDIFTRLWKHPIWIGKEDN